MLFSCEGTHSFTPINDNKELKTVFFNREVFSPFLCTVRTEILRTVGFEPRVAVLAFGSSY
jgi:hypothetical protein